jgi:hypothetical protein
MPEESRTPMILIEIRDSQSGERLTMDDSDALRKTNQFA